MFGKACIAALRAAALILGVLAFALTAPPQLTAAESRSTEDVFRQYRNRVVQVRLIERSSGSKAGIGSGFAVSADGHVVTNYHVVAEIVNAPQSFRLEVILFDGTVLPANLLDLDIVHDLAVVRVGRAMPAWFDLSSVEVNRGERLYSIGNPRDLGFHIVEGTYNGNIENSLYEKINFTGSLNPGMSGGPSITNNGAVVGVNVATQGNQLSFLVPVSYAQELYKRAVERGESGRIRFSEQARLQLIANQARYLERLLTTDPEHVELGSYRVPSAYGPPFRCWAEVDEEPEQRTYRSLSHYCSTQDNIYVSKRLLTGAVTFRHKYLESKDLNPFQFYTLYQAMLEQQNWNFSAKEDDVTVFRCHDDLIERGGAKYKAALCARAYRQLNGLYDVAFVSASLNDSRSGLLSSLVLTGVSFETAAAFAGEFFEEISWLK